ncbi:MAG: carboxypeptidase-like regulatory domain-containing protein [Muribaculaceae bacterium]|nr:carboxypeptidase-like regulatory domain-containing protein [Muribaculaceae bacterium]
MRKLFFLLLVCCTSFVLTVNGETLVTISGTIKNAKNKKVIENVSLTVPGTNIGTVTNAEGFFSLKIPGSNLANGIKAEQIGFQSKLLSGDELSNGEKELTIFLDPTGKVLKELVVLGGDPREIVEMALERIPENYSGQDNLFEGFYRETVQKGNRFISVSEAMVDVLKKPYKMRFTDGEKVSIRKGRKLISPRPADTLSVKLAGGPFMAVMLDVVKNGDHLFTIDEMKYFDFTMEPGAMIDDRIHYAISFKPNTSLPYPLNKGTLYIDGENLALSRVEFELDMSDKNKVTRSILQKKPFGLRFKPQEVSGVVTYKLVDGKSYLNYINSKIKFKCDWKKRLFSSSYTTNSEMVMVDRDDRPDRHLKLKDTFGQTKIFSDVVENYWEKDFWEDYNIIEPTESLEKAVDKLKKSI